MNNLNYKDQEPKEEIFIGQGVTKSIGTDSYAFTIIAIEKDIITIQRDKDVPTKNSDYYNDQKNLYVADPNGEVINIKKYVEKVSSLFPQRMVWGGNERWFKVWKNEKTGRWNKGSRHYLFTIGKRRTYLDPSF